MEILKYIAHIYLYKKKRIIAIFVLLSLFIFFAQYENPDYLQLVCQILLFTTLLIWIQTAPKYFKRINSLKTLFPTNQNYFNLCESYMNRWSYLKIHTSQSRTEKNIRIFYSITWVITWTSSIIIILYVFKLIPINPVGIMTLILLLASLTLNYASYYLSINLVYFIRRVSLLDNLEYNMYLPSATWGLQKLFVYTREGAVTFLVVTFLYTILYMILIFSGMRKAYFLNTMANYNKPLIFIIFVLLSIGFITYIIIFIAPKIFLSNLYKNWKEKSLKMLENELVNAEQHSDDTKIDLIINRIIVLQKDRFLPPFNTIEILVTLSTILINIVGIYNFILKVQ